MNTKLRYATLLPTKTTCGFAFAVVVVLMLALIGGGIFRTTSHATSAVNKTKGKSNQANTHKLVATYYSLKENLQPR